MIQRAASLQPSYVSGNGYQIRTLIKYLDRELSHGLGTSID